MKYRIERAESATAQTETTFVLVAVSEFFENHKTPQEQIAAVSAYWLKTAGR